MQKDPLNHRGRDEEGNRSRLNSDSKQKRGEEEKREEKKMEKATKRTEQRNEKKERNFIYKSSPVKCWLAFIPAKHSFLLLAIRPSILPSPMPAYK